MNNGCHRDAVFVCAQGSCAPRPVRGLGRWRSRVQFASWEKASQAGKLALQFFKHPYLAAIRPAYVWHRRLGVRYWVLFHAVDRFWFAQDNYQSERFYTELLASSVHIANVGRFLLPPKPRHRSDPIMYGIAWIMSSCLASGTFAILEARTHLSLCKDAPVARAVQAVGGVVAKPLLGRLHHRYIFLRREQLRQRDTKTMSVTSSMHKRGHSDAIAERQRRPGGPLG
jgi:hypothetical protein